MDNKLIRWVEVHRTGGEAVITISQEKAIAEVKKSMPLAAGRDMLDSHALEHFMTTYTAWYVEDEEVEHTTDWTE